MSSAFIQAAVILLREGLEAMLVIAALAGYLTKAAPATASARCMAARSPRSAPASSRPGCLRCSIPATTATSSKASSFSFAAALMLYVSGWLMVKQDPRGWQDYLAHKADSALAQDTVWAVGALAFLAVFREGAETVLFINALAKTEGGWSAGLFAGLARGDGRPCRAVLFHQPDCAKASAAAAVHHHLRIPVRDGDQVHRRGRAGIPGAGDHHGHRGQGLRRS